MVMDWIRNWISSEKPAAPDEPSTLRLETANPHLNRPIVFDPSFKHMSRALRAGEPQFATPQLAAEWQSHRTKVLWHVLSRIAASPLAEHLILRGSAVMASWFGELARIPGDLDWVVIPAEWKMDAPESLSFVHSLLTLICGTAVGDGLRVSSNRFAVEDIWSYEKAPGRRIVFSWESDSSHIGGTIQMDIVFGEQIPDPPVFTDVQLGGLPAISCRTASRAQALAWKLSWLCGDMHPMGKDLYDAVLLAESMSAPTDLIRRTFQQAGRRMFNRDDLLSYALEWDPFIREYPHITGTADDWLKRLFNALDPKSGELCDSRNSKEEH